jgi:DNA anti-recombination protein RmuC
LSEEAIEEVKQKVGSLTRKIDAIIPVLEKVSTDLRQTSNTLNSMAESFEKFVKEICQSLNKASKRA